MHQLTDVGLDAMARELLNLAGRDWDRETPQLRAEFRGYVDQMVRKASEAEERQHNERN